MFNSDPGLVVDVVVFHDGTKWRAVVDVGCNGDLTSAPVLCDYKDEKQYSVFLNDSFMSFSVNIYDDGKVLSIVSVGSGSHGEFILI